MLLSLSLPALPRVHGPAHSSPADDDSKVLIVSVAAPLLSDSVPATMATITGQYRLIIKHYLNCIQCVNISKVAGIPSRLNTVRGIETESCMM